MFKSPSISSLRSPGSGTVILSTTPSSQAVFSTLNYSYPLKLLSPSRYFGPNRACLFCLTYVGLLGGDQVNLAVVVEEGAMLVLLTQGSTKVFKARRQILAMPESSSDINKVFTDRPTGYPSTAPLPSLSPTTRQTLRITVQDRSSLFSLPSPITCFANAAYAQSQRFDLDSSASNLLVLDSLTSGRMERGEEWKFKSFVSTNEVYVAGKRMMRDRLCLADIFPSRGRSVSAHSDVSEIIYRSEDEADQDDMEEIDPTEAKEDWEKEEEEDEEREARGRSTSYLPRVAPYSCYATLLIHGPSLHPLLNHLTELYASITHYPTSNPFSLVWSFSTLEAEGGAGIVRIAGAKTEEVREFIKDLLHDGGVRELVGRDLWNTCWIG